MSAEPVEVLNAHRSAKGVQRTQGLTVVATQPFFRARFPSHFEGRFHCPCRRLVARHLGSWKSTRSSSMRFVQQSAA